MKSLSPLKGKSELPSVSHLRVGEAMSRTDSRGSSILRRKDQEAHSLRYWDEIWRREERGSQIWAGGSIYQNSPCIPYIPLSWPHWQPHIKPFYLLLWLLSQQKNQPPSPILDALWKGGSKWSSLLPGQGQKKTFLLSRWNLETSAKKILVVMMVRI